MKNKTVLKTMMIRTKYVPCKLLLKKRENKKLNWISEKDIMSYVEVMEKNLAGPSNIHSFKYMH